MTGFEKKGIPDDLLTPKSSGARRLKVNTVARDEASGARGTTYVGINIREGVSVNNVFDSVFVTGDRWVVVEAINAILDFTNVTSGNFKHTIDAAVMSSNGSVFTYNAVNPLPPGRSVNSAFINDFPLSRLDLDLGDVNFSGTFDYNFFYEDFYLDVQGSRSSISSTEQSFFDVGKIIITPNTEVLVRAESTGSALGTADVRTTFFISELLETEIG